MNPARQKAWETRKQRYGSKGHARGYRRITIERLRERIAELEARLSKADQPTAQTLTHETPGTP